MKLQGEGYWEERVLFAFVADEGSYQQPKPGGEPVICRNWDAAEEAKPRRRKLYATNTAYGQFEYLFHIWVDRMQHFG